MPKTLTELPAAAQIACTSETRSDDTRMPTSILFDLNSFVHVWGIAFRCLRKGHSGLTRPYLRITPNYASNSNHELASDSDSFPPASLP